MMDDLLLLGAGGHCQALIDVIEREGRWRIAGIVDSALQQGSQFSGYAVLGNDDDLARLRGEVGHAMVAVGQIRSPGVRQRLFERLVALEFGLPSVVSPLAEVSRRAVLGSGTVVMHFAGIGPNSTVGSNVIINTRALIEHDGRIGDHCHISTGCILNGGVQVEDRTFIGSGSIVREGICIGAGSFVGMGSRVIQSLPAGSAYKEPTR